MGHFKYLLSPCKIGHLTLSNRMVVSAMVTNYANEDGTITPRFLSYYEEKAKGGWGLLITENFPINPSVGSFRRLPQLCSKTHIAQYQEFTKRIHSHGSKILAQIYHAGYKASRETTGVQPSAPSLIYRPNKKEPPHELTVNEIQNIINEFVFCAQAAQKAGFDGIEIHGGHGYLLNEFTSKATNLRTDAYGGSLRNRMRLPLEIIKRIRRAIGQDFVISYRISCVEFCPDGTTIEESKAMAILLEQAGVDLLNITQGSDQSYVVIPSSAVSPGAYSDYAAQIRRVVSIPVTTVGRINDPFIAESILSSQKADLVVMARASIADPHLPQKLEQENFDDIHYCIGCLQGCVGQNRIGKSVRCMVNPLTGRESEYDLTPVNSPKEVWIAGGGVSGCSAAIGAAMKGHHVTLFEQNPTLGGQWLAACVPPWKSEFATFLIWQKQKLKELHVTVRTNTALTASMIKEGRPHSIIIATGSTPFIPAIFQEKHASIVTANDILLKKITPGKHIAVIGGGLVGAETALYLAALGCKVSIIEMLPQIVKDGEPNGNHYLIQGLEKYGVSIYVSASVVEVSENRLIFEQDEKRHEIQNLDQIVLATGSKPFQSLAETLEDLQLPCQIILTGDAKKTKNGYYNIQESFEAGLSVF